MLTAQETQEGIRIARRMRYWDGIHSEDEEDFVQDVLVEMMERTRRNGNGLSTKEMWRAARCVRGRYQRGYNGKKACSLNAPIEGTEEPIELWETLADKDDDLDAWLDAKARLAELPPGVLRLAKKLEKGDPLTKGERGYLDRFRQDGRPGWAWSLKHYRLYRYRGLCVACGEESSGFARCPRCRERMRAHQGRYRRRKGKTWKHTLRAHWRKQGRCFRCGRAPEPGGKICARCLAKNKEYLSRWRERLRAAPAVTPPLNDLEESILALLKRHPQGMTKRDLYSRLQVPARLLDQVLAPMVERSQVIEVKRENTLGRPPTPLVVAVQAPLQS